MTIGNDTTRVYSKDSMIWKNMTRSQLYGLDPKNQYYSDPIFRSVNIDGDSIISKKEFDAYNNTSLRLELYDDISHKKKYQHKVVYEGMTKGEAYEDEITKKMFDKLNTDNDDKLSYEELNDYLVQSWSNDRFKYEFKQEELNKRRDKIIRPIATAGKIAGAILGLAGGLKAFKSMPSKDIMDKMGNYFTGGIAGAFFGACVIGGLSWLIGKSIAHLKHSDKDYHNEIKQEVVHDREMDYAYSVDISGPETYKMHIKDLGLEEN